MGKKKTRVTEPINPSNDVTDAVFGSMVRDVQAKSTKAGILVGHDATLVVLPVPAFSIRYFLQNTGLPLSCVYQVVGEEGCFKSTFAMEMVRWHCICGGFGLLIEAETKPTPDLRNSVLNWDTKRLSVEDAASFEDWQRKALWSVESVKKNCSSASGPGRTVPFCTVVDSLMGKASEKTLSNIESRGHASARYAIEARDLADFLRAYPQKLLGWPFTFIGVNHLKPYTDDHGITHFNTPGGKSIRFQCATIIGMEQSGGTKEFAGYSAATIRFRAYKNTYGAKDRRMQVRFKLWYQDDGGATRLHSRFEWWEASILLLANGTGLTQAQASMFKTKVKDICDIHEKAGGNLGKLYWSNRLGVPSSDPMPAHDLGMLLETRPDVLTDLYEALGISQNPYFVPGVDFMESQLGDTTARSQAVAIEEIRVKLKEIQDMPATGGLHELQNAAEDSIADEDY